MGIITDIQRFSVHDGPGIRTTVFFKGCPLRCKWCHNPETQSPHPQPQLNSTRCTGCGECAEACENGCHIITDKHIFDTTSCTGCKKCVAACHFAALEIVGYEQSAQKIVAAALRDKPFYGKNGGITLSGGEPTMQNEFCNEILTLSKSAGLNTCIETCGWALDKIDVELCDHIYFDIKAASTELYRKYTGVDNTRIIQNLVSTAQKYADRMTIRTVIVKNLTDDEAHINAIRAFAAENGIERVEPLAFHPYGSSKAEAIGRLSGSIGREGVIE